MKYEGKFADVGTEKTIFREKEGNFMDNIQLLEKKNNLFEEKIRKIDREKLELDSQRNTLKANLENLQHEYDDLLLEIFKKRLIYILKRKIRGTKTKYFKKRSTN